MKIKTKLFLYDSTQENNGYRGTDFSRFVLQGDSYTENITEELDVAELTLVGLTRREEFSPETKFILEKYNLVEQNIGGEKFEEENLVATYHIVVEEDIVSQPILSDDNYFDHHISFIEPSVVAQKRLVDNISATYKLQQVNLDTQPNFDINQNTKTINTPSAYTPVFYGNEANDKKFGNFNTGFLGYYVNSIWGKYFALDGQVKMISRTNTTGSTELYQNIDGYEDGGNYYARFLLPKMKIYFAEQNTTSNFVYIGDASLKYVIQEFDISNYITPTATWEGDIISNSNLNLNGYSSYPFKLNEATNLPTEYSRAEYLVESVERRSFVTSQGTEPGMKINVRRYTDITRPAPQYITQEIPIKNNKNYKITVYLKDFSENFAISYFPPRREIATTTSTPTKFFQTSAPAVSQASWDINKSIVFNQEEITAICSFQTYSTDNTQILLQSSNPYNALSLLQKMIINSHFVEKQQGIFIGDINNMNVPFYIDENQIEELSRTQIIEMFYNQKNLWECLLEIGKYIHSVPKIEFGKDDKFKISFDKLGSTKQETKPGTKVSVMNFKSVADYVSACSSYVENMVQLGGQIDEWVAPKTDGETSLVYNDTCSINVSKPITELLKVEVKCVSGSYAFANVGQVADMTRFTFEETVYNILSVAFTDIPNKGISIYYKLGSNKLTGCNFRNPTTNQGDPQDDYAIKKIIYLAFNGIPDNFSSMASAWSGIKVNDFIFHIVYRTKDSVRQGQTRPDLRKYLLNSKHDRVPHHNQFNNQTDIVVDSAKFGNNVFGKLIRTGNTNYKIFEWVDNPENIKHKGELYRINDELYYVAKVKHTFYCSHIISEIEYSKDYNQLSPIIGIPSEPRFYEISERNIIPREILIEDYLLLTSNQEKIDTSNSMLKRIDHLSQLMFGGESSNFAKYVITTFKGDVDTDPTDIVQYSNLFYIDILSPLNAYSSQNTLTYEWDMVDNFSAGDKVDTSGTSYEYRNAAYNEYKNAADSAYKSLKAVCYTDVFGKAPLLDFYLLEDLPNLSPNQVQELPVSPFRTRLVGRDETENSKEFIGSTNLSSKVLATNVRDYNNTDYNGRGIGILKDCREALSINYNEELLTDSDTFVITPNIFVQNKTSVKVVLLSEEANKLNSGFIKNSSIISPYNLNGEQMPQFFELQKAVSPTAPTFSVLMSQIFAQVNPNHFGDENGEDVEGFTRVKSIAVVYNVADENESYIPYETRFILAKNIPNIAGFREKENAIADWFVGPPSKTIFTNKQ